VGQGFLDDLEGAVDADLVRTDRGLLGLGDQHPAGLVEGDRERDGTGGVVDHRPPRGASVTRHREDFDGVGGLGGHDQFTTAGSERDLPG
jgi:hypothetical protein